MRLPTTLDIDPDINDAAAIAAALFAPELDLQLMTTVAGNVSIEKTIRNALQPLHFWNANVPLAQGASMPLVRPLCDAASVHGESGMEGYEFVERDRQAMVKPTFQAIRDALMHAPQSVTLVAIGPLANIVPLLAHYPECVFNIHRPVTIGGSAGRGSLTPNAEFNIAIDPEAVAKVFQSGLEIVMCGLDVTNQVMLAPDYLSTLPQFNQTGKMLHVLFDHYHSGNMNMGLRMHDLCAIAQLVRPELFALQPCFAAAETQGEYTSGMTAVDIEGRLGHPVDAQVTLGLDVEGLQQWVTEVFARALQPGVVQQHPFAEITNYRPHSDEHMLTARPQQPQLPAVVVNKFPF